jgi:phytoene synthase
LPAQAFAHCEALVRTADRDRFLAALFAPAEHRGGLYALYAFNLEVARVRELVREPLAGEIRLQWWNDAIAAQRRGDVQGHPVAVALVATIEQYRLPAELAAGMIAARRFDLYNEPMRTLADLTDYGIRTSSALIELAGRVLHEGNDPTIGRLAQHAGIAYAIAALLKAFPLHAARGQLYLPIEVFDRHGVGREEVLAGRNGAGLRPVFADLRQTVRDELDQAKQLIKELPPAAWPAFLPAALVKPWLDRMETTAFDPFKPIEVAPWRRQWRLWRAARKPALIFS